MNIFFRYKVILKYTWERGDGKNSRRSLTVYTSIDERLRKTTVDTSVMQGLKNWLSDHCLALPKAAVQEMWIDKKKNYRL